MESEFYTTAEFAAKLGMTYAAFRQAYRRGDLDLPFDPIILSQAKGKNAKKRWRKSEVDDHIEALTASDV